MAATQSYKLSTDGTASASPPLAVSDVTDHLLHLVTRSQATVGVRALAGVYQALDASLDI